MIREIEKIIDNHHINHDVFKIPRNQVIFNVLRIYEDLCRLNVITTGILNPSGLENIVRANMDALNVSLQWIYALCANDEEEITMDLHSEDYMLTADMFAKYAMPYAQICSGYIGFSRKQFDVNISGKTVTFSSNKEREKVFLANMAESFNKKKNFTSIFSPTISPEFLKEFENSIHFENERICYVLDSNTINVFKPIATQQWDATSSLPQKWVFDKFSLAEFREIWILIDALCFVHFYACLKSKKTGAAMEDNVIVMDKDKIVDCLSSLTEIPREHIESIVSFITYNPKIKNTDIMYQPLVELNGVLVITPNLFMTSNAERNLISIMNKNKDKNYFTEVNQLEDIMINEIEEEYEFPNSIIKKQHIDIGAELPDVDFALYDKTTNSAIFCEMKWLTEADSPQEVFAREEDVEHGCQQIRNIMTYAICNKKEFIKKLFDIEDENVDIFYCVITKNDIRSQSNDIPIITQSRFVELLKTLHINSVFHKIRNKEYYQEIPKKVIMSKIGIPYAGYTFEIPAAISDEE